MARPKLTDVPGIGAATAKVLSRHGIRTVPALAEAPLDVIAAVPTFGPARADAAKRAAMTLLGQPASKQIKVTPADRAKPARKASAAPEDETRVEKIRKKKKSKEKKKDRARTRDRDEASKRKPEKKKKKKKDKKKKDKKKKDKKKSGGTKPGKKKDKKKGKKKGKKK